MICYIKIYTSAWKIAASFDIYKLRLIKKHWEITCLFLMDNNEYKYIWKIWACNNLIKVCKKWSLVYDACWCWCKGQEIPIYIWYESYPTHSGAGYEGRVSRVGPNSPYGIASLNLTNIRESDQGWYECIVVFLNRSPNSPKNGTWFHLDVHGKF